MLLVGDLLQILTICKHSYFNREKYCRSCHIPTTPCWLNVTHHHISSSMKHASDPIYLNFLNIIQCRQPTQIKFDNVLLDWVVLEDEILSNINATTTILCIQQINVDNYNNLVLEKNYFHQMKYLMLHWIQMFLNLNTCNNGLKILILTTFKKL